jgi:hypothetical protein
MSAQKQSIFMEKSLENKITMTPTDTNSSMTSAPADEENKGDQSKKSMDPLNNSLVGLYHKAKLFKSLWLP